jgi:hypothetical protein
MQHLPGAEVDAHVVDADLPIGAEKKQIAGASSVAATGAPQPA